MPFGSKYAQQPFTIIKINYLAFFKIWALWGYNFKICKKIKWELNPTLILNFKIDQMLNTPLNDEQIIPIQKAMKNGEELKDLPHVLAKYTNTPSFQHAKREKKSFPFHIPFPIHISIL